MPSLDDIKREAGIIALIHSEVALALASSNVSEETVQKYSSGIYIKLSPKKSNGGSGGGNYQKKDYPKPNGEHGYCKDCQAPNAFNPKTGKTFCSDKCWTKPQQNNSGQTGPF